MEPPRKRAKSNANNCLCWNDGGDGEEVTYGATNDWEPRSRVLACDLDSTLVCCRSGKTFPVDSSDWKFIEGMKVEHKLEEAYMNGYCLVVFSNQKKSDISVIKNRVSQIISTLSLPVVFYMATGEGMYRKPRIGMWKHFIQTFLSSENYVKIVEESIFVGDAAGRQKDWKKGAKKDFSSSDRKFAMNIGLKFCTPEEYFLGEPEALFVMEGFDVRKIVSVQKRETKFTPRRNELVVLVGYPSSGKSTFVRKFILPHGYVHVSLDLMKTKSKCLKIVKESIKAGKSVVVDNTNPSKGKRDEYLEIARSEKVSARCVHMLTSKELSLHLNVYRELMSNGTHKRVPTVAFHVFSKNYEAPSLDEGFDIIEIPFCPGTDVSEIFTQFLV